MHSRLPPHHTHTRFLRALESGQRLPRLLREREQTVVPHGDQLNGVDRLRWCMAGGSSHNEDVDRLRWCMPGGRRGTDISGQCERQRRERVFDKGRLHTFAGVRVLEILLRVEQSS